jgi:hypothetical protein
MSENSGVRNRWVFGLAAIAFAIALALVLDIPGKLRKAPSEPSGSDVTVVSGCRSSCEANGSSASFCVSYCACVLESLNEGRSRREFSRFLLAMAKDPSSEQFREIKSTTEACTKLARSRSLDDP